MHLQEFHPHASVLPGFETSGNRPPDPRLFTHRRPQGGLRCRPLGPCAAGRGEVQEGRASPGAPVPPAGGSACGDLIVLVAVLAVAVLIWAGKL